MFTRPHNFNHETARPGQRERCDGGHAEGLGRGMEVNAMPSDVMETSLSHTHTVNEDIPAAS